MSKEHQQLLQQYRRLQIELASIRYFARKLPIQDMDRWRVSIRANQIINDLQALRSKLAVPEVRA